MPRGYRVSESPYSQGRLGQSGEESRADHYSYWSSTDWVGDGGDDWMGDGPFFSGYGLDLSTAGQVNVANQLAQSQADAANTGGYVSFTDGTTNVWFMGKTNGTSYYGAGSSWTSLALGAANYLSATNLPTSVGNLKGVTYVTTAVGQLWKLTAGTATWTQVAANPLTTPAYILGAYKSKLWIGYANALYYYDGAAWSAVQFTGLVDGTPIVGAVGNGVLYFITQGPNPRVYLTDSNQLYQIATIGSDFLPKVALFLETLILFGHGSDDTNTAGQIWRLEQNGFRPIYDYGDYTNDHGIRSALVNGNTILWGANFQTGIGVYDPSMDIFQDVQMGFYVSSVITSVSGVVHGLAQFGGVVYCAIEGNGIYKQTTPGTYKLRSTLFDGGKKHINKTWGRGDFHHSPLLAGQTVVVSTLKDGVTLDSLGSSTTLGATSAVVDFPSNYKSPYLQYEVSGTANGSALSILDLSFSYVETPDNPKRVWDLDIDIEGSSDEPQEMRDGSLNTRDAKTMFSDLVALWNTRTTFEDIDGTTYNVLCRIPSGGLDPGSKETDSGGTLSDFVMNYRVRLIQLSDSAAAISAVYGQALYS